MSREITYRPGMRLTRLSPKGQLTIPRAHLRQLGWQGGSSRLKIERVGRAIHISAATSGQTPHRDDL